MKKFFMTVLLSAAIVTAAMGIIAYSAEGTNESSADIVQTVASSSWNADAKIPSWLDLGGAVSESNSSTHTVFKDTDSTVASLKNRYVVAKNTAIKITLSSAAEVTVFIAADNNSSGKGKAAASLDGKAAGTYDLPNRKDSTAKPFVIKTQSGGVLEITPDYKSLVYKIDVSGGSAAEDSTETTSATVSESTETTTESVSESTTVTTSESTETTTESVSVSTTVTTSESTETTTESVSESTTVTTSESTETTTETASESTTETTSESTETTTETASESTTETTSESTETTSETASESSTEEPAQNTKIWNADSSIPSWLDLGSAASGKNSATHIVFQKTDSDIAGLKTRYILQKNTSLKIKLESAAEVTVFIAADDNNPGKGNVTAVLDNAAAGTYALPDRKDASAKPFVINTQSGGTLSLTPDYTSLVYKITVVYENGGEEDVFVFGDVSGDGRVAADDSAIVLQKSLVNTFAMPIQTLTDNWLKYADVSGDGTIAADDSAIILQKSLNSSFHMPVE